MEQYGTTKKKAALWGCDNWATILHEMHPRKNELGIELKKYLIMPTDHLLLSYPELQKPGVLSHKGIAIWREYPTYFIMDENPSRTNAIVRIDCAFDGGETPLTRRYMKFTERTKMLEIEVESIRISNLAMQEELREVLGEKLALMKKLHELIKLGKGERHVKDDEESEEKPAE